MEETPQTFTARAVGFRYGMIYGVIGILFYVIVTFAEIDMSNWLPICISILIATTVAFLAHKFYKDNGDGYMDYGQGVGIGFWVGLISSAVSSVFAFIYSSFIDPNVVQTARDKALEKMEAQGQPENQIEMGMKVVNFMTTPLVSLCVGLIIGTLAVVLISLILSIFTQKPRPETI